MQMSLSQARSESDFGVSCLLTFRAFALLFGSHCSFFARSGLGLEPRLVLESDCYRTECGKAEKRGPRGFHAGLSAARDWGFSSGSLALGVCQILGVTDEHNVQDVHEGHPEEDAVLPHHQIDARHDSKDGEHLREESHTKEANFAVVQ